MIDARIRRLAYWLASFSSIAALLSHLPGGPSMHAWALLGFPIAAFVMVFVWIRARLAEDTDLLLRLQVGFIGGLAGTIGYDYIRLPFHLMGYNLFSPIRAYGMWTCGASSSTYLTDIVGFVYHLSNGITFGWIYALVMLRRHWAWAVVWGLLLETLAVVTPFGEVFAIRGAYGMLALAYVAHVFYGVPLGLVSWHPERAERLAPLYKTPNGRWLLMVVLVFGVWFVAVRPAGLEQAERGVVTIETDRILPTWTDMEVSETVSVVNRSGQPLDVILNIPDGSTRELLRARIEVEAVHSFTMPRPGVVQVAVEQTGWRSVFIAVSRDGDYRPDD